MLGSYLPWNGGPDHEAVAAVVVAVDCLIGRTTEILKCVETRGVLTSVDSDEHVQPIFNPRNSKWCSVSSLTLVKYSSDYQRLWSDCAYAGWSEALLVAHTTLLEVPCLGSKIFNTQTNKSGWLWPFLWALDSNRCYFSKETLHKLCFNSKIIIILPISTSYSLLFNLPKFWERVDRIMHNWQMYFCA